MKPLPHSKRQPVLYGFLLLVLTALWACSPAEPPDQAAATFWAATLTGDKGAVRQVVLPNGFVSTDFDAARHHEMFDSVVIGETQIEGNHAWIKTRLQGVFYGEASTVEFNTVAVIHNGEWKIDYSATASEMIATFLGYAVSELDQAIRLDVKVLEESVEESVREDLKLPPPYPYPEVN